MSRKTNPLARLEQEGLPDILPGLFDNSCGQTSGLKVRQYDRKLVPGQSSRDAETEHASQFIDIKNLETFGRIPRKIYPTDSFAAQATKDAFPDPVTMSTTPTAVFWQDFSAALHLLPRNYPSKQRAFLTALAEIGDVDKARRLCGVKSKANAYSWLKKFAAIRKANAC